MVKNWYHIRSNKFVAGLEWPIHRARFWGLFKKKKKKAAEVSLRPGAMTPEQVKQKIESIGEGRVVEIIRIGYDGQIDDMPLIVEITGIYPSGFSGRIVNVEREMIEKGTSKLVYARRGGGTIEFRYDDGDIKEIKESEDEEFLTEERDIASLKEILSALEKGDRVLIAYYEAKHRGSVNAEGTILEKSADNTKFKILLEKINRIELEDKMEREFDIEKDLVIDIELL